MNGALKFANVSLNVTIRAKLKAKIVAKQLLQAVCVILTTCRFAAMMRTVYPLTRSYFFTNLAFTIQVTLISNYWLGTMSNNNIRKSLIASAFVGAFTLVSGVASATTLAELQKASAQTTRASVQSQEKINNIYDQSQELLADYRSTLEQAENLKVYNDHVAKLVADQDRELASLDAQIGGIETTKQNIVPLMYKMVDTLEAFIKADMPVKLEERLARVAKLREYLGSSSITTSEMYRVVLEAYSIENQMAKEINAYQGKLNLEGKEITADFVHVGRVALLAQSLDLKNAWVWNKNASNWQELPADYLKHVTDTVRMARKQKIPDLVKLPVFAAE